MATGRSIFRAGLAVSCGPFRAEAEGVELVLPGGRRLGLQLCFPARHGLGVARACVEDHSPEPPGLDWVTALLGQDGEVAQGRRSTAIAPRLKSTNGSSGRSASSASRILQSRWSLRSRSAGSVEPVCRTLTSVHRTGTFARRSAGKICSCTAYDHRTSSRTGNSRIWSTTVHNPYTT